MVEGGPGAASLKTDEQKAEHQPNMRKLAAHCFDVLIHKLENHAKGEYKTPILGYPADQPDPEYPIFVTWTKGRKDDLRGCIGTFAEQRLSKILGKYALISALQDDRFEPVELAEVKHLNVGVSLLVNFTPIPDPLQWEVGKHGIEIEFKAPHGSREYSGTFLPEVAEEEGWDQRTTLEYLIQKAGYRGSFDAVKPHIKAKTYESLKVKLTYEEYMTEKKLQQ